MTTTIYIAGKYTARERLKGCRAALRSMGYNCPSSWMDEEATDANAGDQLMFDNADRDLTEVAHASTFILDTLDESNTGGREVELGYALAHNALLVLVGPRRNIFHRLMHSYFDTWEELLAAAEDERALARAV